MRAIMDLQILPIGVGNSLSSYITACERVLTEAGLKPQLHAFGTDVQGEWGTLVGAVRRCHEVAHQMGAPRVVTHLKLETRSDGSAELSQAVESVQRKLALHSSE